MATNSGALHVGVKPAARKKKWQWRSIVSLVLFIIAMILTPVAAIGHWTHATLTDTQAYLDVVGPLAANEEIQEAVGKVATNAIVTQVDTKKLVGGFLTNVVPDEDLAAALTGPLSAGVNQVIGRAVRLAMATDAFQTAWVKLNTLAQRSLVAALEGDPQGVVQIKGPDVVLDIGSVLVVIQQSLEEEGIGIAAKVKVPESDTQIVLMSSTAFEQLRTIWTFANPVLASILLVVALLFTLSVMLAVLRARTAAWVGVTLFVIGAVLQLALAIAESRFTNAFAGTAFEAASNAFYRVLVANLTDGLLAMMLLGVVLVIVGWFAGSTGSAQRARAALTRGFANLASRLPQWAANIGRPLREYASAVRWTLLVVWLIAVFTASQLSFDATLGWTALFLGLLSLVEILMSAPKQPVEMQRAGHIE